MGLVKGSAVQAIVALYLYMESLRTKRLQPTNVLPSEIPAAVCTAVHRRHSQCMTYQQCRAALRQLGPYEYNLPTSSRYSMRRTVHKFMSGV